MERSLSDITISSFLFFQTPKQSSTPPGARPVFTFSPRAPEHLLYVPARKAMLESFGKEKRGSLPGESGGEWKKIFLTAGSEFVPQGDLSSPFSRRLLPRLYLLSFMPPPISLTATDEGRKMRLRHSNKSSTSGPKRKVNLFSSSPFRVVEYGKLPIAKKKPWARVFPFCGRN